MKYFCFRVTGRSRSVAGTGDSRTKETMVGRRDVVVHAVMEVVDTVVSIPTHR